MKHLFNIFILLMPVLGANLYGQESDTASASPSIKALYISKCAGCHGLEGDGQGAGAAIVEPKPRNFQTWMFKYKSTPASYPPLDQDLAKIIKEGLDGTSMPGFKNILSEKEIDSLVQYLKTFSFFPIEESDTLPVVEVIQPQKEPDISHGRALFEKFDCIKCHGEQGRGDGPSFDEQEDDWSNKIYPRNLTKPWTYRRGSQKEDIYKTLKLGIPGTGMPSFIGTLEQEGGSKENIEYDLWSLAAYVHSLQEPPHFETTLKAGFNEQVPENIDDNMWDNLPLARFHLIGQVVFPPRNFTPSIEDIAVKAVHNGKEVAVRVQWDDPSETTDSLPDIMAVQFPVQAEGRKKPFFFLGEEGMPVNLWVFDNGEIYEATAQGQGTMKKQKNNDLTGSWKYKNGRYQVMFKRNLTADNQNDATLLPEKFVPVAFLAWNGNRGENGSQCALSSWYYFVPKGKPSAAKYYGAFLTLIIVLVGEILIFKRINNTNKNES